MAVGPTGAIIGIGPTGPLIVTTPAAPISPIGLPGATVRSGPRIAKMSIARCGVIVPTGPSDRSGPSSPLSRRSRSAARCRKSVGAPSRRHRALSRGARHPLRAASRGWSRSVSPRRRSHEPNPS
ncbi:MAG: hypothetical protein DMD27_07910 [Gemmatimonadetes bacterium]|nr:MAG: hypothetical protein DMD27_07910 [Gemmatimonadota bacterium]